MVYFVNFVVYSRYFGYSPRATLGLFLFHIFVNDISEALDARFLPFTDDIILSYDSKTEHDNRQHSPTTLQEDLNSILQEKCVERLKDAANGKKCEPTYNFFRSQQETTFIGIICCYSLSKITLLTKY